MVKMETDYEKIAGEEGTPVFLFDRSALLKNFNAFREELRAHFVSSLVCYSVKTNSSDGVVEALAKEGSGFDVGSEREMESALWHSSPEKTVFNGPCKREEELRKALDERILLINIDSFRETERISGMQENEKTNVGIRVEFKGNKLGFSPTQILKAFQTAKRLKLNPVCLMAHPGTGVELNQYALFLKSVKKIYSELENDGILLEYLDLGGGLPCGEANWGNYFELIEREFGGMDSTLILEPGRALVENAFSLLSRVHYLKEKDGARYAILDAGINVLPKITLSKYSFKKIGSENQENKQKFVLGGPLLFGNDSLGIYEGNLREDDLVLIENVGAYCFNLAWEISFPKPKIIEV